jgi:hypothetical protein
VLYGASDEGIEGVTCASGCEDAAVREKCVDLLAST